MMALIALVLGRPNALDRQIDALTAHELLTHSAFALLDPARTAASVHLEQSRLLLWALTVGLQVGVLAWFWSSGKSAALRDRLRRRFATEFAVRFCFGALIALLDKAISFVPDVFAYRIARIMGLTDVLLRSRLSEWIVDTLLTMVVAGIMAAVILWLADRTHQWYLYTIAGIIGFMLLVSYMTPFAIAPAHQAYRALPLSSTPAREAASLERRTGIDVPLIELLLAGRTRLMQTYVEGWGGSQRIVVSDTAIAAVTEGEMRFLLARSYAWIAANDGLHLALVQGAFLIVGTALAVLISDRIGFRRDDDPVARLALLGSILGIVYAFALPLYNGYSRNLELAQDAAAVALTADRASAVRFEVRRADEALLQACPGRFAGWYLDARPSPGRRIAALQSRPDPCVRRP